MARDFVTEPSPFGSSPSVSPADAASVSRAGAERPIIFSAPMVRALLAGRKTQTRRVLKKQDWPEAIMQRFPHQKAAVPYLPGDRLWVKEPVRRSPDVWLYEADGEMVPWPGREELAGRKRDASPAMYLPRACSRLTLLVSEVRVQRLKQITNADAIAEGATSRPNCAGFKDRDPGWCMDWSEVGQKSRWARDGRILTEADVALGDPVSAFGSFINGLHDKTWNFKGDGLMGENPWVAAVTFDVVCANIDAAAQAIEARRAETQSGSACESAVGDSRGAHE